MNLTRTHTHTHKNTLTEVQVEFVESTIRVEYFTHISQQLIEYVDKTSLEDDLTLSCKFKDLC